MSLSHCPDPTSPCPACAPAIAPFPSHRHQSDSCPNQYRNNVHRSSYKVSPDQRKPPSPDTRDSWIFSESNYQRRHFNLWPAWENVSGWNCQRSDLPTRTRALSELFDYSNGLQRVSNQQSTAKEVRDRFGTRNDAMRPSECAQSPLLYIW